MNIDLDTRDLIRLEREPESLLNGLRDLLVSTSSRLVLSAGTITEVSAPLFEQRGKPGVMSLLNRLETLPLLWLRTADIERSEIAAAMDCFGADSPYRRPTPFVPSYLDTLINLPPYAHSFYKNSPLARVIWDIAFGASHVPSVVRYGAMFGQWVAVNRADMAATPDSDYPHRLRSAYNRKVSVLAEPLPQRTRIDFDAFLAHLWDQPDSCPATRLAFEALHIFFRDTQTKPTLSDMHDFTRMLSIPYVDVFTADGAKRDYLRSLRDGRQSRLRGCSYWSCALAADLDEVLEILATKTQGSRHFPFGPRGSTVSGRHWRSTCQTPTGFPFFIMGVPSAFTFFHRCHFVASHASCDREAS